MTIAFTVITPCYNCRRYLPETVTALSWQTHLPAEWLFVDNGSTDGSAEYIESIAQYLKFPVRVLRESRRGPSAARNCGIREARSDWIAFLDADDLWIPDKLERQVEYLQAHPETDLLFSDVWHMDSDGRPFKRTGPFSPECITLERIFLENIIYTSSVVVRRHCLAEEGGFCENIIHGEDLELWIRLLARYRVGYMPEPLAAWRTHPGSLMESSQHYADQIELSRQLVQRVPALAPWQKRRDAMVWYGLGRRFFLARGEHAQARSAFWKATRLWPSLTKVWKWWLLSWLSHAQVRRLLERFEFHALSGTVPGYTLPVPVPPFEPLQSEGGCSTSVPPESSGFQN
jgi:glycosyltransferase involved in cell wall biosynthesis